MCAAMDSDSTVDKVETRQIWTNNKTIQLIQELKLRPCLWNKNDKYYKNKHSKESAIDEMAEILNLSESAVKNKIRSLRTIYFQNSRKSFKRSKGRGKEFPVKWEFYNALHFLKGDIEETGNIDSPTETMTQDSDDLLEFPTRKRKSSVTVTSNPTNNRQRAAKDDKKGLLESVGSYIDVSQKELTSIREVSKRKSQPNSEFGEYVAMMLQNISDITIVARTKLQIKLLLSKATIEASRIELNKIGLNNFCEESEAD